MIGRLLIALTVMALGHDAYAQPPMFDAHLHYDQDDAKHFTPEQIADRLRKHSVARALVTSAPAKYAQLLYRTAPRRIVPFLGVYEQYSDKETWHQHPGVPDFVRRQLDDGPWRGIGELHLFAEHRHAPVFRAIVALSVEYEVPLLMHADPAVIDTIFEIAPAAVVIWAHAGTFPYPDLVDDYLARYPNLYVDLSMRDERVAPGGELADSWYGLFVRHPDRFFVGVDTYSVTRWRNYENALGTIRNWLAQLPPDIAANLAYKNAARLFSGNREGDHSYLTNPQ